MPRAAASPARARRASTAQATQASTALEALRSPTVASVASKKLAKKSAAKSTNDFANSVKIYLACVSTLAVLLAVLFYLRPPSPSGGVCDGVSPLLLLTPSSESIMKLWQCTKAYQQANYWFVLAFFMVTYTGLKMMAIPAAFALCLLSGAMFPMPYSHFITGTGEALGSSLCYLLSKAFLAPIVERFFADKLAAMQARADENRQYMLTFNFFLRLTPFMPNWAINLMCPLVGVPLKPFFIGSLIGTQLSLFFLAVSGSTLKTAGETGFDLQVIKDKLKLMALLMAVLQCVPLLFIYLQKQRDAAKQAHATKKPKSAKK